jgi:hypothetical protein
LCCSSRVCRNDSRSVRSLTIGSNTDTVPTFVVSAPFETGMLLASAGAIGHARTRLADTASVGGINEKTCRRDGDDNI